MGEKVGETERQGGERERGCFDIQWYKLGNKDFGVCICYPKIISFGFHSNDK